MSGPLACLLIGWIGAASDPETIRITLERTACFGPCPIYTVALDGDGSVSYDGKNNVRVTGQQWRRVSPEAVRALAEEMKRAGFFSLRERYDAVTMPDGSTQPAPTDGSTTTVTLTIGERTKKVVDYFGSPAKLRELERRIDEVAGTRQWVFIDFPTLTALSRQDGWKPSDEEAEWLLRRALEYDDVEILSSLLALGFDPDRMSAADSTPPLLLARSVKAVRALLAAGADPNARGRNGGTPLDHAASYVEPEAVRALLAAGAWVDEPSYGGRTPLLAAACEGNADGVGMLLAAGAYPSPSDQFGTTAGSCATAGQARQAEEAKDPYPFPVTAAPPFKRDFTRVMMLLQQGEARRKR